METNLCPDKILLALRCLLAASKLDPEHPMVHEHIVRFKLAMNGMSSSISPKTAAVVKAEFTLLPESTDLAHFNDEFLAKHNDSALHILAGVRVRKLLANHDQKKSEADVHVILDLPNITLLEATEGLKVLVSWNSSTDSYRSKAHSKWPEATIFAKSE